MPVKNYSFLTLTPIDDEEKKLFWKFRVDSMQSDFQIYTAILLAGFLQSLVNAVIKQESHHTMHTVSYLISLIFQVIVIILSKRCTQRAITYMYPSAFGLTYFLVLITLWYNSREEDNKDDFGYEKFIEL